MMLRCSFEGELLDLLVEFVDLEADLIKVLLDEFIEFIPLSVGKCLVAVRSIGEVIVSTIVEDVPDLQQ